MFASCLIAHPLRIIVAKRVRTAKVSWPKGRAKKVLWKGCLARLGVVGARDIFLRPKKGEVECRATGPRGKRSCGFESLRQAVARERGGEVAKSCNIFSIAPRAWCAAAPLQSRKCLNHPARPAAATKKIQPRMARISQRGGAATTSSRTTFGDLSHG